MGKALQVVKALTFTTITFVFLCGMGLVGLGAWMIADTDNVVRYLSRVIDNWMFAAAVFTLLSLGGLAVIFAIIGFVGTGIEHRSCIGVYFAFMVIVTLGVMTGATFGFIYRDRIGEELLTNMERTLTDHYGMNIEGEKRNKEITYGWDRLQASFECCGISGDYNSEKSWKFWQSSRWFTTSVPLNGVKVPESCCTLEGGEVRDLGKCQGTMAYDGPPGKDPPFLPTQHNDALHETGCYGELGDYLLEYSFLMGVLGFVVAGVIFLALITAGCLCRYISKKHSQEDRDMMGPPPPMDMTQFSSLHSLPSSNKDNYGRDFDSSRSLQGGGTRVYVPSAPGSRSLY